MRISLKHMLSMFFERSTVLPIISFVVILVLGFVKGYVRLVKEQALLNEQHCNSSSKTASSKRKKNRKLEKHDSVERKDKHVIVLSKQPPKKKKKKKKSQTKNQTF
jgi:hypothetical protein